MTAKIEVKNVAFWYSRHQPVLRNLSFQVEPKTFLAIVGPNGAGKSTLLNLLCGALHSKRGTIQIDGRAVEQYPTKLLASKVAVVRQEFVPVFGFTVAETVMMARTVHFGPLGFPSPADFEAVDEALGTTETRVFAERRFDQLSGGERQRVFIARALAQDSDILLLDEPTNFLDLRGQVGIYDLLKRLQLEQGKTIVAVTHDINLGLQYADQALLLKGDGGYRVGPTEEVLTCAELEPALGVRLEQGQTPHLRYLLPVGNFSKNTTANRQNSPGGQGG